MYQFYKIDFQGAQIFQKSRSHLTLLRRQQGDKKLVQYWEPTVIRRQRTKFSCHGDLSTL